MNAEERNLIRGMIDAKQRDKLAKHEASLHRGTPNPRNVYWRAYYTENRKRILALRRARRAA